MTLPYVSAGAIVATEWHLQKSSLPFLIPPALRLQHTPCQCTAAWVLQCVFELAEEPGLDYRCLTGKCKGDTNKGVFLIHQEADGNCLF